MALWTTGIGPLKVDAADCLFYPNVFVMKGGFKKFFDRFGESKPGLFSEATYVPELSGFDESKRKEIKRRKNVAKKRQRKARFVHIFY